MRCTRPRGRRLRRAALPLALVATAALTGCLEVKATTTIGLDGSGAYRQVTTVRMKEARAYLELLRAESRQHLDPGAVESDLPVVELGLEEHVRRLRAQPGISELRSKETTDAEEHRHTHELSLRFESLAAFFDAGALEDVEATLARRPDGSWDLTLRHTFLDGDELSPAGRTAKELAALRRQLLARFEPYWGELEIVTTLTVPTRVLTTNGQRDEAGRTVTWRLGFEDLVDPQKLTHRVAFANAEGLKLEPYPPAGGSSGPDGDAR